MGFDLQQFWPLLSSPPGVCFRLCRAPPKATEEVRASIWASLGLGDLVGAPPTPTVWSSLSSRSASWVRRGCGPVIWFRSEKLFWNHSPQQSTFLSCLCIVPSLPQDSLFGG